jgi:hypothetical protein
MFGGHGKCDDKIHSLETQALWYLNQIQELKAINDYQTFSLEQKIKELELELTTHVGCIKEESKKDEPCQT